MAPELPKELTFMDAKGAAGKMQESAAGKAEEAHQFHHGKAAAFLLIGRLGIGSLILRGVGHGEVGAIDDFDRAGEPEALAGGLDFHALSEMAMDVQEPLIGEPQTGLAIGAGVCGDLQGCSAASTKPALYARPRGRQHWGKELEKERPRK